MIKESSFGFLGDGREVRLFTFSNENEMSMEIINYGAIIKSVLIPDSDVGHIDVALGFDTLQEYENDVTFMGSAVGRFANRIAFGKCHVDGEEYNFPINLGRHHLHGGPESFNKILWNAELKVINGVDTLELSHLSPDGHQGFPGNLDCIIRYSLTNDNSLVIEYEARTDRPTILNFTNHSYFNVKDGGKTDVKSHMVQINSSEITEVDDENIPTGTLTDITGSAFDFKESKLIGDQMDSDPKVAEGGFDHNFVLDKEEGKLEKVAEVVEPDSGRSMKVYTTSPGVQFFTASNLEGVKGKGGITYDKFHAFCLETQNFPDAPNHNNFPSAVLRPGEVYREKTIYQLT